MSEFRTPAEAIIRQAGGLNNIVSATHCMTRLRLELHDESLLDQEGMRGVKMVKGLNKVGNQYQIILGTGIVNKVYAEVDKIFQENNKVSENGKSGGTVLQKVSRLFGDIFIPVIPVIVSSGILMGVRTFLTESGVLGTTGTWYTVLSVLIDTGFTFLPALVAYSAAKKFGGNPLYGFVLGLMLLSSSLPAGGAVGKGNAELLQVPFFDLFTISVKGYQGSVMVAIVAGYFVSLFERLWRKVVPNVVDMILTPILTLACSFFLILFGVGPVIQLVEAGLLQFFLMVLQLPIGLGGFICGALQQVLVITDMHHGLWFIDINMLAETGRNFYQPIRNAGMMGQAGACIAFALLGMRSYSSLKVKDILDICHVSSTTVFRFCKKLNVSGFSELKFLLDSEQGREVIEIRDNYALSSKTNIHLTNITKSFIATRDLMTDQQIDTVVAWMQQARKINIFANGSTSLIGRDLEYKLDRIGVTAKTYDEDNSQYFAAMNAPPEMLCFGISYSGQTKSVLRNLRYARGQGAKTILITNVDNRGRFQDQYDLILYVASNEAINRLITTTARLTMLYLVDLIFYSFIYSDFDRFNRILLNNRVQNKVPLD